MDGCKNYTVLSEADRVQGNTVKNELRDGQLTPGWYRFQGAAGDQMADKCVLRYRCGTHDPGWLSGALPTVDEGVVVRKVCYHAPSHPWDENCCHWRDGIKVKNCSSYYVYELQKPPIHYLHYLRYCGNAGTGKLHFSWLLFMTILGSREYFSLWVIKTSLNRNASALLDPEVLFSRVARHLACLAFCKLKVGIFKDLCHSSIESLSFNMLKAAANLHC